MRGPLGNRCTVNDSGCGVPHVGGMIGGMLSANKIIIFMNEMIFIDCYN